MQHVLLIIAFSAFSINVFLGTTCELNSVIEYKNNRSKKIIHEYKGYQFTLTTNKYLINQ